MRRSWCTCEEHFRLSPCSRHVLICWLLNIGILSDFWFYIIIQFVGSIICIYWIHINSQIQWRIINYVSSLILVVVDHRISGHCCRSCTCFDSINSTRLHQTNPGTKSRCNLEWQATRSIGSQLKLPPNKIEWTLCWTSIFIASYHPGVVHSIIGLLDLRNIQHLWSPLAFVVPGTRNNSPSSRLSLVHVRAEQPALRMGMLRLNVWCSSTPTSKGN